MTAVTDLLAANEGVTDPAEKKRLRVAVFSMMRTLTEIGRVTQVEKGKGKKQGTFQKVATETIQRTNGAEHTEEHAASIGAD